GGTFTSTAAGYFNDPSAAAQAIKTLDALKPPAVYMTLNPIATSLLARSVNKVGHKAKFTVKDDDISERRWLFIDIDSKRKAGISATDSELHEAYLVSDSILNDLKSRGWPEPLQAMSGNGRYLLFRVELPNDEESRDLIQRVLHALAGRFNTDGSEVDTLTFNAARIIKAVGTFARKGDELVGVDGMADRPHRQSWFIIPDGELQVVSREQLQSVAEWITAEPKAEPRASVVKVPPLIKEKARDSVLDRASKYIAKMDRSVEGSKGSNPMFYAACQLVRGFDLSDDEAFNLLLNEFNPRCEPPWSEKEIRHKIKDARIRAKGQPGHLLVDNRSLTAATNGKGQRLLLDCNRAENSVGIVKQVADQICERNYFAVDRGGRLYYFAEGTYKPNAEVIIKRLVKRFVNATFQDKEWKRALNLDVIEYITIDSPMLWETPPIDVLNVKNGLIRLSDHKLLPHDPRHLSTAQLPVAFDSNATCPNIDKFISETFPEDCTALAYETTGWLMLAITCIQKAILLFGQGGNGKSVFLNVLCQFIGKLNYSSLSLHKLESDRFAASRLIGKLANICPDLPNDALSGTSIFKAITGGDEVTAEYKFKDSFDFLPFARLIFSSNSLPRSNDQSQGFFDRWVVVPFDRSFRGEANEIPRSELDARLTNASELSGLLNKALSAITEVKKRNWRLTTSPTLKRALTEFHSVTDPLGVWLDQFTIDDPDAIVPKAILRSAYGATCEQRGNLSPTDTAFGLQMKRHRPDIAIYKRTYAGKVQWCYVGIGLRSELSTSQGSQGSQGFAYLLSPTNRKAKGAVNNEQQDRENLGNLDYLGESSSKETHESTGFLEFDSPKHPGGLHRSPPLIDEFDDAERAFLEAGFEDRDQWQ
ncbi:MAG: phage/plasmid primase, P4 family, partial [Pirellulaceae bacterium]